MKCIMLFLETVLLLIYSTSAFAEDIWTFYNTKNSGITSNHITAIAATENEVIWIGHDDGAGISQFDGERWETFTLSEHYRINDICVDGKNVWIAAKYGLFMFDGIILQTYFPGYKIHCVQVDNDGNLWIGGHLCPTDTERNTLSKYDRGKWVTWFLNDKINCIAVDNNNVVWCGVGNMVYSYDGFQWKRYAKEWLKTISSIVVDHENKKWFASEEGYISCFDDSTWYYSFSFSGNDIAVGRNNTLWFAINHELTRYYDGELAQYKELYDMDIGTFGISSIAVCDDGTIWLGTYDSGIIHLTDITTSENSYEKISSTVKYKKINTNNSTIHTKFSETNDYFPLGIGNKWIYNRRFSNESYYGDEPYYEDKVIFTIIDTMTVDNTVHFLFLDGNLYRKDDKGNVYQGQYLIYDFTPCEEINCDNGIYQFGWRKQRKEKTIEVPAGIFNGYEFKFGALHGEITIIAPPVGMVWWNLMTDVPQQEVLELEYARINGQEYGSTTHIKYDHVLQPVLLSAPYPNPFNTSTTISFTLHSYGLTSLVIYNIMGQKVRELLSNTLCTGLHSVLWDGKDDEGMIVSSGVYVVHLIYDSGTISHRLTLLK